MTPPLTGYEQHGGWTTLAEETDFLAQVVAETAATYSIAAYSSLGQPVHRIDLGVPDTPTILFLALQHGDEPAPRESTLMYLRELAYSTDPAILDYLTQHRLVFLPTVNPSALPNSRSGTGPGGDVNRAHFNLARLEAVGVAQTIADVRPDVLLDMHEYEAPGGSAANDNSEDHWIASSGMPSKHPAITAMGGALVGHIDAGLVSDGYSVDMYPSWSVASLVAASAAWHTIGVLSEAHRTLPVAERVDIVLNVLESTRVWHRDNLAVIQASIDESIRHAVESDDDFILATATGSSPPTETINVARYQTTEPLPAWTDVHGIERDPDGHVSMNQRARHFVAYLLDPLSPHKIMDTVRLPRPPRPISPDDRELPRGKPVRWRITVDGMVRDVVAARMLVGGKVRKIKVPGA